MSESQAKALRFPHIDLARSIAIVFALTSHLFIQFDVWSDLPNVIYPYIRLVTRTATPAFFILFGMMLEIVYSRRMRRDGFFDVSRILWGRAMLCYLAFAATLLLGLLTSKIGIYNFLLSVTFLKGGLTGVILKIYAVVLFLSPLFVAFRIRFGSSSVPFLLILFWVLYPTVQASVDGTFSPVFLLSFILGSGGLHGPAILPGLTFMFMGLLFGELLAVRGTLEWRQVRTRVILILLVCVFVLAQHAIRNGPSSILSGISSMEFRRGNHIVYYAYGVLTTFLILLVTEQLCKKMPSLGGTRLTVFGRSSLFSFAAGNMIITVLPRLNNIGLPLRLGVTVGALVALYFLVVFHEKQKSLVKSGASVHLIYQPIRAVLEIGDFVSSQFAALSLLSTKKMVKIVTR